MSDRVIGILGGMGPEATAYLYGEIIKATPVTCDQDHFRVIIDSNPRIPDRTAAILGEGPSPVDALIATGRNLERAGADIIAMPCITAHYFIEEVRNALSVPILNMLQEMRSVILGEYGEGSRVGVLATAGTVRTGMMERYLTPPCDILYPGQEKQAMVMEAIYGSQGIKRGHTGRYPLDLLTTAAGELIDAGAGLIIAGCTELPLVLRQEHLGVPLINPLRILALALVAGENSR